MNCKIVDLIIEVPATGDLVSRCQEYLYNGDEGADIIIRTDSFKLENWPTLKEEMKIYMESGFQFYGNLLKFCGMLLHASAVEVDGKAYLFSGPCGMGKSTHTRLWKQNFGGRGKIINDDKPALRKKDEKWFAYGTPWCGKDGINLNRKVPLVGICFLKQAPENRIRRLTPQEAMQKVISQTMYKFVKTEDLDLMLTIVNELVHEIPIFELENRPELEAAQLSYETMRRAAEELGL